MIKIIDSEGKSSKSMGFLIIFTYNHKIRNTFKKQQFLMSFSSKKGKNNDKMRNRKEQPKRNFFELFDAKHERIFI